MRFISLVILFVSFAAVADETCKSSVYNFRITSTFIEATGQGEVARLPFNEVRNLSRRSRTDFKNLVRSLQNNINSDVPMTADEAALIQRFSLTLADGNEELISMMYTKGYDQRGQLVVRYVVTDDGAYRCQ